MHSTGAAWREDLETSGVRTRSKWPATDGPLNGGRVMSEGLGQTVAVAKKGGNVSRPCFATAWQSETTNAKEGTLIEENQGVKERTLA